MNIIHIAGNRPQFIKLGILHQSLTESGSGKQLIIHTGQHSSHEMSNIFFGQFNLPEADIQLDIPNGSPDIFIGHAASAIQQRLSELPRSIIIVYGDTNTTLAGAIAATRTGHILVHIEAGVRTAELSMPEEINRILTDRLAQLNFCCTAENYQQLVKEGYGTAINSRILLSGDLMYDAFLHTPVGESVPGLPSDYIACTIHRAQNITQPGPLGQIVTALNKIHREIEVIVPLHPHTAKRLQQFNIQPAFRTIPPMGYLEMKRFLQDCRFVITDSGGAARESYFSHKPSLVIMDNPFWPEIIATGAALQSAPQESAILEKFGELQQLKADFTKSVFGNGDAAQKISAGIRDLIGQTKSAILQ